MRRRWRPWCAGMAPWSGASAPRLAEPRRRRGRKAASLVPREMVGNWLYSVAYQTALKARATAAIRRTRERQVTVMPEPEPVTQDLWHHLQPLLDQALSRLPDKQDRALRQGLGRREVRQSLQWHLRRF